MVIFNFYSWREREHAFLFKRTLTIIVLTVFMSSSSVYLAHAFLQYQYEQLQTQVEYFKVQITSLSSLTTPIFPPQTNSQLYLAKQWSYELATRKLFASLAQHSPALICFDEIKREQGKIMFSGEAKSAVDLTDFLLKWKAWPLFSEINITQMQSQHKQLHFNFIAQELSNQK